MQWQSLQSGLHDPDGQGIGGRLTRFGCNAGKECLLRQHISDPVHPSRSPLQAAICKRPIDSRWGWIKLATSPAPIRFGSYTGESLVSVRIGMVYRYGCVSEAESAMDRRGLGKDRQQHLPKCKWRKMGSGFQHNHPRRDLAQRAGSRTDWVGHNTIVPGGVTGAFHARGASVRCNAEGQWLAFPTRASRRI